MRQVVVLLDRAVQLAERRGERPRRIAREVVFEEDDAFRRSIQTAGLQFDGKQDRTSKPTATTNVALDTSPSWIEK